MLKPVLDIGVPALVIPTMVAVGLGLTVVDSRRVVRRPRLVAAATMGLLVFFARNVGVATAVAVLGRIEFTVFAAAYLLNQAPLLLAAESLRRRLRAAAPGLNIAE